MFDNYEETVEGTVTEALLLRYIKDKVNYNERSFVDNWLEKNNKNRRILAEIAYIYKTNESNINISKKDSLLAYEITKKRIYRRKCIDIIKYVIPVAATVLLFILIDALREHFPQLTRHLTKNCYPLPIQA